jgi:molybdopterin molybdotransferase
MAANLLNVDLAVRQILEGISPLPAESVNIEHALGRVLAEDIRAAVSLPPFANSSMDGYAVRTEDVANASQDTPIQLRVVTDIPAGMASDLTIGSMEAARIMTGAPLPAGADAVVPVENTDSQWSITDNRHLQAEVSIYRGEKCGANVRPVGEDIQAGQTILRAGTTLRPQDIGVLVALGYPQIQAIRQPKVAILSTGDELIGVNEPLSPGKIRDSNSYTIAGLVAANGGIPIRLPIARDTLDEVRRLFQQALEQQPDIVLSSAGVSVGAFDVVRTILDELGQVNFWRVNLRPGKPLAFGHLQGVPFFGLPGNPVSAMITFEVFVRPALLRLAGKPHDLHKTKAIAGEDIHSDGRRTYVRVKLSRNNGQFIAHTTGTQSSGALMSMVLADGLLIVPEDVTLVPAGEQLELWLLRDLP